MRYITVEDIDGHETLFVNVDCIAVIKTCDPARLIDEYKEKNVVKIIMSDGYRIETSDLAVDVFQKIKDVDK